MNIQIFEYFEWAAFLTGVAFFKSIRKTPFVVLVVYLFIIVLVESGNHLGWFFDQAHKTNNWLYNILLLVEFPVMSFLLFSNKIYKKKVRIFWVLQLIYFSFYIINIIFIQSLWLLNTNTIILLSIIIICIAINLLYRIAASDNTDIGSEYPYFFLSIGVLLFYVIEILLYAIFPYLAYSSVDVFLKFFILITNIGITILNLSIILLFISIWYNRKKLS